MEPEGEWNFYTCQIGDDDAPAVVFVRTDLFESTPDPSRPWAVLVSLTLKCKHHRGLLSSDEVDAVWRIQASLAQAIQAGWNGTFVGRYITKGQLWLLYYVEREPDTAILEAGIESSAPGYLYSTQIFEEPGWNGYRDCLYPNEIAWLEIGNTPVLEAMMDEGDTLEQPRHTLHWLYFPTRSSRDTFATRVRTLPTSFDVVEPLEPDEDSQQWGVRLEHQSAIDMATLIALQLQLKHAAEELEGKYDGFECALVRSPKGSKPS